MSTVNFTVNGASASSEVERGKTLLRYLRDDLGLMGTKDGCTSGDCGSCVVQVDGKPVDSCVYLMKRADGVTIETIDGLAGADGTLHPIQAAFLEKGAVQCGFCIPGMIMASKAAARDDTLPDPRPDPRRPQEQHLSLHRVRADLRRRPAGGRVDGQSDVVRRAGSRPTDRSARPSVLVDGTKSVQGLLPYADDLVLPGMLDGTVVWSEHPYARLLSVDVSGRQGVPRRHWVLTADDVPGLNAHGRTVPDQPVFAYDYVRFTGDPIALVLADTRERPHSPPRDLVKVEYEPLPGLFDPTDSLAKAPRSCVFSRAGQRLQGARPRGRRHRDGVRAGDPRRRGPLLDPAPGSRLPRAARLPGRGEGRHGHGVRPDAGAVRDPRAADQDPRPAAREDPRSSSTPLGGGFGGKLEIHLEGMAAVAAYVTRKPVKIMLPRGESLRTSGQAPPVRARLSRRGRRRGHAARGRRVHDLRRRAVHRQHARGSSTRRAIFACGPYRVPNVRIEGKAVLTNNPLGGAFRGYGINQAAVAME